MGKKHNIIFNLSIEDLKELGIIKKKSKRKRTKRKYIQPSLTQSNIKLSSDHMSGFINTSNLQSENMRLHNNLLENYPTIAQNIKYKGIEDAQYNPFNIDNRFQDI